MARHRYNVLSLWSLSPFPSLVKVPEYPKVALADVKRKTGAMFDATNQGRDMYDPSWPLETVKTMTIDEKIAFWRGVMQYAQDRGIDVSVFTWNIFVYGTEGSGYGITVDPRNATTKDYVRQVHHARSSTPIRCSPRSASRRARTWATSTTPARSGGCGRPTASACRTRWRDAADPESPFHRPGRRITLIHRAHQADLEAIVDTFKALPGSDRGLGESTLAFSFKYSQAHMHSSTAPQFIFQNGWYDSMPAGKQTWLTVRNDDLYYLRWGDPDFVRALLAAAAAAADRIAGFMLGPDGYTWGRDFVSTRGRDAAPAGHREAVVLVPALGPARLRADDPERALRARSSRRASRRRAGRSSAALASTSKILPLVNRFYWGYFDFQWYPEGSWSQAGFVGVRDFITPKYPPMREDEDGETLRIMSVKAFVDRGSIAGHLTPLEVASEIDLLAADGVQRISTVRAAAEPELQDTLGDIRAMAALGRYYAAKIRGAVELARYEQAKDASAHARARTALQASAEHWREYARLWSAQNVGNVFTRLGPTLVDMTAIQAAVDKDIPCAVCRLARARLRR